MITNRYLNLKLCRYINTLVKHEPTNQGQDQSSSSSIHKDLVQSQDFRLSDPIDPFLRQLRPVKLPPVARTKDLLHIYGIRAKKNLSQNFLLNQRLVRAIVRAAGVSAGHRVVEIGPGPGNLTRAILEKSPFEVLAIEKDRRFLPLLDQLSDSVLPDQLKIILGDALDYDFKNIFGDPIELAKKFNLPQDIPDYVFNFSHDWFDNKTPPIRLIGNLPFSVCIPMLLKWLRDVSEKNSFWQYGRVPMLLTFQEEVGVRICAKPATYERSRLSAMVQNYCFTDLKFIIKGTSFTPQAGVNTAVIRLDPRKEPYSMAPYKLFEKFVRHLFHHRNHDLAYNYATLYPVDMRTLAHDSFKKARVNPKIYPYMISNYEVARLCDEYHKDCQRLPSLIEYNYRVGKKLLPEMSLKVLKEAGLDLLS